MDRPRVSTASEVPKAKSPRTHNKMEAFGEGKAESGQSIKLGKVARKLALARYSAEVELCAGRANEKTRNANNVRAAMACQQPLLGGRANSFVRRGGNTNSPAS